jgi:D-ribose pyranose/furanose isomerase RbsD
MYEEKALFVAYGVNEQQIEECLSEHELAQINLSLHKNLSNMLDEEVDSVALVSSSHENLDEMKNLHNG